MHAAQTVHSFHFCKSSRKICCTIVFGMPLHSALSLHEDRRSSFKILAMWAMFSHIPVIVGLPLLCSSQIDSRLSEDVLYHRNTVTQCTADPLQTFWIISNVFVALKPAFQPKQIAARCSIVFSITIYDTDKTNKLCHILNIYTLLWMVGVENWNAEKKFYWRTSLSFMKIALLTLYFHGIVLQKLPGRPCISKFSIFLKYLQGWHRVTD